jgi:hypothetical protein
MRRARDSRQRRHLLTWTGRALAENPERLDALQAQALDVLDAFDLSVYNIAYGRGYRRGYSYALSDNDRLRAMERARLGLSGKRAAKRRRKTKR